LEGRKSLAKRIKTEGKNTLGEVRVRGAVAWSLSVPLCITPGRNISDGDGEESGWK